MKRIAVFASGTGTNAEAIINHFATDSSGEVALIVSNKVENHVVARARNHGISYHILDKLDFAEGRGLPVVLEKHQINFIVLAGFMWLIPAYLTKAFQGNIVNIHPALLPKYGGKGMYGMHVHRAVLEAGEAESGITIHHVNENYDEGQIIFQATCTVDPADTPELLAQKVHELEHEHYAKVISGL